MKKIDNKGWGMGTFLIIVGLLFCVILLIAFLANQYDNRLPSSSRDNSSYVNVDCI